MACVQNPAATKFFQLATEYIKRLPEHERENLPVLESGKPSKEKDAWYCYFRHLGWVPAAFNAMLTGEAKAFTTPAQWPWWLDLTYPPPDSILPAPDYSAPPKRAGRESYEELKRRYGPDWGIQRVLEARNVEAA